MDNLPESIIRVFLTKQVLVLKDSNISHILHIQGIQCSEEEVRRHVQSLCPALFQISSHKDKTITIRVDPQIDICGAFLSGRCHHTVKPCDKLHICRHFDNCVMPKCRFPHDFNHGPNQRIVQNMNCQNIDCQLIVQMIRMKKNLGRKFNSTESLTTVRNFKASPKDLPIKDDINKQIDVSYPSSYLAKEIDVEVIELCLNSKKIQIEKEFKECQNEYFRRITIQLTDKTSVDELLASPSITYGNTNIKFKRTKRLVDQTSFLLKINSTDEINESRLKLYANILIGNGITHTIFDLSTSDDKIFLIRCNKDLDFDRIHQQYQTRSQLQGKDVKLVQIYECDNVTMSYIDENKIMNFDDLETILQSFREIIFTFQLISEHSVEIEFINTTFFKQWMATADKIQTKFRVQVTPIITEIDDEDDTKVDNDPIENISSNPGKSNSVEITLRKDRSMIVNHSVFQLEYKNYIRDQLGGEIEINDDTVTYTGSIPHLPRAPTNEAVLGNKTNNYMQKFKYQTLRDLKPRHLNILHANSNIIAFRCIQQNDYTIAGKPNDLFTVRSQLFPRRNSQAEQRNSPQHNQLDNSTRSPPVPLMRAAAAKPPMSPAPVKNLTNSLFSITKADELSMFSIKSFEDRLQEHLKQTYQVQVNIERYTVNIKTQGAKTCVRIKLTGETNDVEVAINDLTSLFSLLRTREFNDKTDGNWTKIEGATEMIQHHFTLNNLLCVCEKVSSAVVNVYYFDVINPQFGIDGQEIEDVINQFSLAAIIYNPSSSSKFNKEWADLEEKIRKRNDYRKDICFHKETNSFYLFGLTILVKDFHQKFEQLRTKYIPQPCKFMLSEKQLNYLRYVARNELSKLEKQYKSDGCDISFARLQQSANFLAPIDMHSKIKDALEALTQINEVTFEIKSNAFHTLISKEPESLSSIVKSKCYFTKNIRKEQRFFQPPKSQVVDLENATPKSPNIQNKNSTSININKSTITILIGDLTKQTVDMIVVCSTSEILCQAIITAAGPQIQAEYSTSRAKNQQAVVTSNGLLPCKQILFIPWKADQSDLSSLKPSISKFVATAMQHAVDTKCTSIAFPSIGCGKLGFDPSLIADYMLDETITRLISTDTQINVSFVLVPNQQNVYDAFIKCLNSLQSNPLKQPVKTVAATANNNNRTNIPYDMKIVEITLVSANNNHLDKCKNDILELSRSCMFETLLTDKQDMIDWSQNTINSYYNYCLKRDVIPTLDFDTHTVQLVGLKDAVHEAEKHFYELTTETLKQARIHAVSRGIIWSFEVTSNSDTWEQYSFKLNGNIEDAYLKKLVHLDFINDKQERCRIIFSKLEEHHGTDIRRIRRKVVDSTLPDNWEPSDQNFKRVVLQQTSKEFQDVLEKFNATMKNQTSQIVRIERIQNERWYKQYAAHRDEYKQRHQTLDERLLFHGCPSTSADQIMQECFNRSFAGVNGVAYGCGVYFHSNASYSHSYTKTKGVGERTMFLASVLIGKTIRGSPTMKVPPAGYDTTTDGQNIFVIYHDAGAYANYLITYK